MAADPLWLERWMAANGPFLCHVPNGTSALERILSEGIIPWNQGPGADIGGTYLPRPDHVYLGVDHVLREAMGEVRFELAIRVDLRELDPSCLNPDEDVFWSPRCEGPLWDEFMGLEDPSETVAQESPEVMEELYEEALYTSYGAWAEANHLGSNPVHTHLSLERSGVLAHRGVIPPCALTPPEKMPSPYFRRLSELTV